MEFIKERVRKRRKVIREAVEWADGIPYRVTAILIGSYARGDFNLWSDVDILLVAEFIGNPIERLRLVDMPPGFQVIPLTEGELLSLLMKGDPMAVEALKTGVILRDSLKLVGKMKQIASGVV